MEIEHVGEGGRDGRDGRDGRNERNGRKGDRELDRRGFLLYRIFGVNHKSTAHIFCISFNNGGSLNASRDEK